MGMFVYVNENGAMGIILADDIIGAASVVGQRCNSDVVMKELDGEDYYEEGCCAYSLSNYNFCEWPWLVTREIGTDYEYKLCKRQNTWGTPWGAVDLDVKVTPYGKE